MRLNALDKTLTNNIAGISMATLIGFLEMERSEREDYITCLQRIALKFNWSPVSAGEIDLNAYTEHGKYLEIQTDLGDYITFIQFGDSEKINAFKGKYFKLSLLLGATIY